MPGRRYPHPRGTRFSYVNSETRSNGRGVAVWFSMYDTSFLVIGLYLHASRQYEDYEPLLSWAWALVISSPGTWCVVLGDLNCNPGSVAGFPRAPDISEVFDQFVLDALLTSAELPPMMRQRFNAHFAQHVPPDWESKTPSEIFHFIQTNIPRASKAVFGPHQRRQLHPQYGRHAAARFVHFSS